MISRVWICLLTISWIAVSASGANLSVSEIQATGKILFRELRDSECKVKCKSRKPRIMCGSDGVSYQSKCELKRARRCEGKKVIIKKKGKCSEQDVPMTKCFQEKDEALTTVSRSGATNIFIPECNSDGTFAEVQCHAPSQYCWCVSPSDGKPLKGSSTNNGKPKCKDAKVRVRRKNLNNKHKSKSSKKCTRQEKRKFNVNLVKVFTEEYNRSVKSSSNKESSTDTLMDTIESRVVDWKFSQYDSNGDSHLTLKEVNSLRRLVKKYIKPKSCAKRFLKFCDPDRNKLIERREWTTCLGVDINKGEKERTTPVPEVNPSGESLDINTLLTDKKPSSSSASSTSTHGKIERPSFPSLPINMDHSWPGISKPRPETKPRVDKQPNDCRKERIVALEQEADNPDAGIFLPNCTPEGKWTRAQCHKSTGYCWCVEENSGRPISGTSTQGVDPKCDFEGEREIQGCNYVEKQSFIADLLTVLKTEMTEYALNNSTDHSTLIVDPQQSLPERAVRWRFNSLDVNSNKLLDNGEIETFKTTTLKNAQRKQTRKCARRFVRYCDEDGNKRITEQEWVECMGITRNANMNLPSNPKRTGKNPFDEYLRDT